MGLPWQFWTFYDDFSDRIMLYVRGSDRATFASAYDQQSHLQIASTNLQHIKPLFLEEMYAAAASRYAGNVAESNKPCKALE